jgi:UDP-glucose 4-epimerase
MDYRDDRKGGGKLMDVARRKVCISGGAGFIGSKLARAWLARGAQVTIIDNLSTGTRQAVPEAALFVECDVLDTEAVIEALRDADLVYHLAARVAVRSSFEFVVNDTKVNVCGTASMLRAAASPGTARRFVFTSSMAVYADSPIGSRIDESWPANPISPYGISKLAAEQLTHQLCSHAGMESVVLRLFNTYGPGQQLSPYVGLVTIVSNRLAAGENPVIYGDGEQCRDFVHVDDVVQALVLAGTADITGKTFNIGTGRPTTVNQVVESVQAALGIFTRPVHVAAVEGELRSSVPDISRARTELGYEPRRTFDSSIAEVVHDIAGEAALRPR